MRRNVLWGDSFVLLLILMLVFASAVRAQSPPPRQTIIVRSSAPPLSPEEAVKVLLSNHSPAHVTSETFLHWQAAPQSVTIASLTSAGPFGSFTFPRVFEPERIRFGFGRSPFDRPIPQLPSHRR